MRSQKTTPQRASSCPATCSASVSRSVLLVGAGRGQQRPASLAALAPGAGRADAPDARRCSWRWRRFQRLARREQRAHGLEAVGGDDARGPPGPTVPPPPRPEGAPWRCAARRGTSPPGRAGRRARRGPARARARPGATSPRAAARSQGRSSRNGEGHRRGPRRRGRAPARRRPRRRRRAGDRRPHTSSPEWQRSSSQRCWYPSTRAGRIGLLPRAGGDLETLELVDDRQHAGPALALGAGGDVLPAQQEAHELLGGDGLDLAAQAVLGVGVDARQQPARAPLLVRFARAGGRSSVTRAGSKRPRMAKPSASSRPSPTCTRGGGAARSRAGQLGRP